MTSATSIFGNLTIDDLVFADGSTRWAVPGGSAAYAAMGASLWTESASIIAPIGPDYPLEALDKRIDLSRCRHVPRTLRNWGLYEDDGRRHFVSRSLTNNWLEFSPDAADARSGHQTAAHIAPMPHGVALELIRELRRYGTVTISLDLDDHDLLGNANLEAVTKLLQDVDLFLPSHQDVLALIPDASPPEGLRKLRALASDVALIAIKCGAAGVVGHAGGRDWVHIPSVDVKLVDVTGAGDAFCGGVLASYAEQGDPLEALICGSVAASFCVEGFGFSGLAAATEEEARTRVAALRQRVVRHATTGIWP